MVFRTIWKDKEPLNFLSEDYLSKKYAINYKSTQRISIVGLKGQRMADWLRKWKKLLKKESIQSRVYPLSDKAARIIVKLQDWLFSIKIVFATSKLWDLCMNNNPPCKKKEIKLRRKGIKKKKLPQSKLRKIWIILKMRIFKLQRKFQIATRSSNKTKNSLMIKTWKAKTNLTIWRLRSR